jgi:hypothetical protein
MMALDAKRDVDAGIHIERCREEVDNLVADVMSKLALVRLFPLGHELVHCAGKTVYNSAL